DPVGIAHPRVAELERIPGDQARVTLREGAFVHQHREVGARRDPEMETALGAGPEVLLEDRLEQRLAAALALGPQPLGQIGPFGLVGPLDALAFALEPAHAWVGRISVESGTAAPMPEG